VQVSKRGSTNILQNSRYRNERWHSKPRDRDHGKVRPGDLLLIYFAKGSSSFKGQLRRVYRVIDVSEGNIEFELKFEKEINPLTYRQIRKYVEEGILSKEMKRCGQMGFNIKQLSEEDFEKILQISKETPPVSREEEQMTHEDVEGLLLHLGNLLGFDTYTSDKSLKTREGEELRNLCTLKEIPAFTYPETLDTVKEIDVIWFKDGYPRYCFEVEHSTDVTKGLLRLYQVKELRTSLFVVAPSSKQSKFEIELRKDPFNKIKERYVFRTYTRLLELYDCAQKFFPLKTDFGIQ
jgi:hypothetical protein